MADSNFVWPQGEDLYLRYIYEAGATEETLTAVDLSNGYAIRMDIVVEGATNTRVYTFNSGDITDVDPALAGDTPDTNKEATLTSGAGGTPNITIKVPRSLTLPGGPIYDKLSGGVSTFKFDVFLRNTTSDEQVKIDRGAITVEKSYTLWQ